MRRIRCYRKKLIHVCHQHSEWMWTKTNFTATKTIRVMRSRTCKSTRNQDSWRRKQNSSCATKRKNGTRSPRYTEDMTTFNIYDNILLKCDLCIVLKLFIFFFRYTCDYVSGFTLVRKYWKCLWLAQRDVCWS